MSAGGFKILKHFPEDFVTDQKGCCCEQQGAIVTNWLFADAPLKSAELAKSPELEKRKNQNGILSATCVKVNYFEVPFRIF